MKFENTEVFNFEGALRGMRFPLQSGDKADSYYCLPNECYSCPYINETYAECCDDNIGWTPYYIGENDMDLAQRLVGASSPHDKFLRQILISTDITASLTLWKQLDQYRIGVTTDSESTMHTLAKNPITIDMFDQTDYDSSLQIYDGEPYSCENYIQDVWEHTIDTLEIIRQRYNETKDKRYWQELIRLLPESFLQKRHWTANYAVLRNIYFQRKNHKLSEWHTFCEWIESLPYAKELITYEKT